MSMVRGLDRANKTWRDVAVGSDGNFEIRPSSRRNAGVLHRDAITAVDKLSVPTAATGADVATGGSLLANTTYNMTVAAQNRWGATTVPAVAAVTTAADASNTHVFRATLTQVTGADGYDLFLSTAANPLWVARITEAQRAAAGTIVTGVGTVGSGGPNPAGTVDIRVVGTGVASNANPFGSNNAYTPASPTAVDCTGFSRAHLMVKLAVTDLRSLPTLKLVLFHKNQISTADFVLDVIQTVDLLTQVGEPLLRDYLLDVDGSTGLVVLVDTITGQGAACSVWVELG